MQIVVEFHCVVKIARASTASLNLGDWPRNCIGFLINHVVHRFAAWPRCRISSAARGTASGTLTPQSQALFIHNRSAP